MMKRGVSYNGLDCLADASSDAYMKYKHQLQAEIPWVSQTKYAKYTVYFGIATIFVAFVNKYTTNTEIIHIDPSSPPTLEPHSLIYGYHIVAITDINNYQRG